MDSLQRHRSLYKATTPPWKEVFRKRCVDRLDGSRARLLDRYRKTGDGDPTASYIAQEVKEKEWTVPQPENRRWSSLWGSEDGIAELHTVMKEYDEQAVFEEIQQELQSDEVSIIEEYERNQQIEQQYLSCVMEGLEEAAQVICPMCHMNYLNINGHVISCSCGLYINTEMKNITPDVLRHLLESRILEHMEGCSFNPVFSLAPNVESSPNLLISCKTCDFLSIVL
ncbi:RPA-interacting protein A-like [Corythoichthys intestinalis]|uniref:RPA-interacting protein A-like n=1 Tax=Corythoichthys intestinalis TaxID=161448 RepID=UPI0025A4ED9D|nr:RPA-interacting protein A-like [Corythoichthys intestinalis]XP_061811783.1 RPA-interacting protein A-like [Nerophis lumbriciformis]